MKYFILVFISCLLFSCSENNETQPNFAKDYGRGLYIATDNGISFYDGDTLINNAFRNGYRSLLGMAWCWRTANNHHDGGGGLCCAGAWPPYPSHPMVYKFMKIDRLITLFPARLKVTSRANDHRGFLARFGNHRQ